MATLFPFRIPFGNDPGRKQQSDGTQLNMAGDQVKKTSPIDQMLGHTAPEPDVSQMPGPRVDQLPFGQSGRANFFGLPEQDELNQRLQGTQGLRIFDEMYWTDPHIRRLVLMAWAPILTGTWHLEPFGGDKAGDLDRTVAEVVWWMLTQFMSPNFFQHLDELGAVVLRSGFCPFEQIWATCEHDGKTYQAPRKLDIRLPRSIWRWWQDDFGELTYIGQILPNRADVIIPATDLCYYRISAEGDNWMGRSLLRHCFKPYTYKERLERIDAIGQERKAVGVPVVYCSPDVNETVRTGLEQIVANMHTSEVAYVFVPGWKMGEGGQSGGVMEGNQFLIDVIQFDSSSGETIQASLQYHKQAIESSFAMDFMALGQHQVGARATADIQEDPYLAAVESIKLQILPTIGKLIDRIVEVNWGDKVDGSPTLDVALEETASLSEISAYLQQLVMAEVVTPDPELEDWVREHADMPPANPDVRQASQAARMAGLEQAANPPDPMEMARVQAQARGGQDAPPPRGNQQSQRPNPKQPPAGNSRGKNLDDSQVKNAGLIVQAADTGRIVMVRRSDDAPDAAGKWETPGGSLDDGEEPWTGAVREWQEETGATLPKAYEDLGTYVSDDGQYQMFAVRIPRQAQLSFAPDGDEVTAARWTDPQTIGDADNVRNRLKDQADQINQLLATDRQVHVDVAVDFDGVLHPNTPDTQPLTEKPIAGAVDVFNRVAKKYKVAIFTARTNLAPIKEWMQANGFADVLVLHEKPIARWYIDDHNFPTGFPGWAAVVKKLLDAAPAPPHLRRTKSKTKCCATCSMYSAGVCNIPDLAVRNYPVDATDVCDRYDPKSKSKRLDATSPSARWFERLLSQDRLREAFDGCRDHIQNSCQPAVSRLAAEMAGQAANGQPLRTDPPDELVDALAGHYSAMYDLGQDTVQDELAKQRRVLNLDTPVSDLAGAAAGSRAGRARDRAQHSAQNIVNRIGEVLGRQKISGLLQPTQLQKTADQTGVGQLRLEALTNTASQINDGRNDAGTSSGDVVGAYYTSVLDNSTCGECEKSDDGELLSPTDAVTLGPPNPMCEGGDRCRCALVWVLSSDPSALSAVT